MPQFETPRTDFSGHLARPRRRSCHGRAIASDTTVEVRPSDPVRARRREPPRRRRASSTPAAKLTINAPRRLRESYSPFSDGWVGRRRDRPAGRLRDLSGDAALARFHLHRGARATASVQLASATSMSIEVARPSSSRPRPATSRLERASRTRRAQRRAPGTSVSGRSTVSAVIKNSNGDTRDRRGRRRISGSVAANGDIAVGQRPRVARRQDGERSHPRSGAATAGRAWSQRRATGADRGLGSPEGTAAWLDVNTNFGHLHNGLDAVRTPRSPAATSSVEVRARTGLRRHHDPAAQPAGAGRRGRVTRFHDQTGKITMHRETAIEIHERSPRRFGEIVALDGLDLERRGRHRIRPARPQRSGQDHARTDPCDAAATDGWTGPRCSGTTWSESRSRCAGRSASQDSSRRSTRSSRAARTSR